MKKPIFQLLDRVRTFTIQKWTYHKDLNPYHLASIGYFCVDWNVLECAVCKHRVSLYQGQQLKPLSQILTQLNNHYPHCEWNNTPMRSPSIEDIYLDMDEMMDEIKASYTQQNHLGNKMYAVIDHQQVWSKVNPQLSTIHKIMNKYEIDIEKFRTSFMLVLMGWKVVSDVENPYYECYFCGRRVYWSEVGMAEGDQHPVDRLQEIEGELFNPVKQHRYFCHWVHGQEFWKIYVQHLWDKLGESQALFRKSKPEEMKKIRIHLNSYLGNFNSRTSQICSKINDIIEQCSSIAQHIEEGEEKKEEIRNDYEKRKHVLEEFVKGMEEEVRQPLRRLKID